MKEKEEGGEGRVYTGWPVGIKKEGFLVLPDSRSNWELGVQIAPHQGNSDETTSNTHLR